MSSANNEFIIFPHGWKLLKQNIKQRFGQPLVSDVEKLENEKMKIIRLQNKIIFNKRCKKNGIIPKWCRMKDKWDTSKKMRSNVTRFQHQAINDSINFGFHEIKTSTTIIRKLEEKLQNSIPDIFPSISHYIKRTVEKLNEKIKSVHINKFEALKQELLQSLVNQTTDKIKGVSKSLINLSKRHLSTKEEAVLELGLNFSIPTKHHKELLIEAAINTELALSKVDTINSNVSEQDLNNIRVGIAKIIDSEKNKPDQTVQKYAWITHEITTLKRDQSIIICPADKGNTTVILDRDTYELKIKEQLNDANNYELLNEDPNVELEKEIREACLNLKKFKRFTKDEFKYLAPSDSRNPQLYGLPKIHKEGIPIRIIIDCRPSPQYNLAKYQANILKILANEHPTTLKNSYQIGEELKNIIIPPGYHMVSFDVVSLFTNVPIDETLLYIMEQMRSTHKWKELSKTKLSIHEFMKLLYITVKNNYFVWKKQFYKQKNGTPMGSPISPVFAELFLQKLEKNIVTSNEDIFFWRRLVDDCFAIIPIEKTHSILQQLNSFHPSIQFTMELEVNNSLPFLDLIARRDECGYIHRSVFRKPTHSGRYLNFQSYHPMCHKISVIDSLSFRAYILCDEDTINQELDKIREQLNNNGYPHRLISERMRRMKIRSLEWSINRNLSKEENDRIRIILPYVGPFTTRITKFIRLKLDCDFGFHPGQKLGSLLNNAKEKSPQTTRGIYRIICSCKSVYVGETSRTIEQRDYEHHHQLSSAVNDHLNEFPSHQVDSASLIERESREYHRKFKEHLWIIKYGDMNKNNGKIVNPIWTATLIPLLDSS